MPGGGARWECPHWPARFVSAFGERLSAEQFERTGQRVAERRGLEPGPSTRGIKQAPATLDLRLQVFLALTRCLELFIGDAFLLGVERRLLYLARQLLGVAMPDTLSQTVLDVIVDDFREASELSLYSFSFLNQNLEHSIFDPLRKYEIVAVHFRSWLKFTVNTPVALLDAVWIPGQIEMKQIRAMRLEVQAFPGRIGREQDT